MPLSGMICHVLVDYGECLLSGHSLANGACWQSAEPLYIRTIITRRKGSVHRLPAIENPSHIGQPGWL